MSEKKIIAQCKNNDYSYISASGRWLPCCSFPDHGPEVDKSIFSRPEFFLENVNTFNQFHELDIFKLWVDHIEDNYECAIAICKKRCGVSAHQARSQDSSLNWVNESLIRINNKEELDLFLQENKSND